jgi:hypothetical protein
MLVFNNKYALAVAGFIFGSVVFTTLLPAAQFIIPYDTIIMNEQETRWSEDSTRFTVSLDFRKTACRFVSLKALVENDNNNDDKGRLIEYPWQEASGGEQKGNRSIGWQELSIDVLVPQSEVVLGSSVITLVTEHNCKSDEARSIIAVGKAAPGVISREKDPEKKETSGVIISRVLARIEL